MQAQKVDFVSIPTRDLDRAAMFYGETLGLGRDPLSDSSGRSSPPGTSPSRSSFLSRSAWRSCLFPPELSRFGFRMWADARTELEQEGVAFEGDTFDSGACHMAFFRDPDGNGLMLHHRYKPYHDGSTP